MVRSYLEHRMGTLPQPVKMWCAGPMFRYERPQKGRYRQFWQVDFESLGSASPYADAEIIALSLEVFRRLGLSRLEVVINSVGCPACRPDYRRRLTEYFSSRRETCAKPAATGWAGTPEDSRLQEGILPAGHRGRSISVRESLR